MQKVYLINVTDEGINICELSEKGYDYFNSDEVGEYEDWWGDWSESLTMDEIVKEIGCK